MITFIERLKELIFEEAIVTPYYDANKKKDIYTLEEKKSPDSQIQITGIPEGSIIFNLDDFFLIPKPPTPYIFTTKTKNVCSRADYIIVAPDCQRENKFYLVFIELKKSKDKSEHVRNRLCGARCFMDYCVSLINHFWEYKIDAIHEEDCRYVACLNTGSDTSNRYDNNESPHKSVDAPLKLEGRKLFQYNQLIGRKPR